MVGLMLAWKQIGRMNSKNFSGNFKSEDLFV